MAKSEEEELQEALGFDSAEVSYTLKKRRRVNEHVGHLEKLDGAPGYESCIVCRCGWVHAFMDETLQEATDVFVGHVQPGSEWISE